MRPQPMCNCPAPLLYVAAALTIMAAAAHIGVACFCPGVFKFISIELCQSELLSESSKSSPSSEYAVSFS